MGTPQITQDQSISPSEPRKGNKLVKILIYVVVSFALLATGAFGLWFYQEKIEMTAIGRAKDRNGDIMPNPEVKIHCTFISKDCKSFSSGNFICKTITLKREHCSVNISFSSSISGKLEKTSLARFLGGQPGEIVDLGEMIVPLEDKEQQSEDVEAYNLSEKYLNAFIKKDWEKIESLGINCGLDRSLIDEYSLKAFVKRTVGRDDNNVHSYFIDLKDCETDCEIGKNKIIPFEIYLQKEQTTNQWKCWSEEKSSQQGPGELNRNLIL